jgi:nucleoside-diphosphate-sugar epimerase
MAERVAVLGAGGFIGNRMVEVLHLAGLDVVPIVRRSNRGALPGRFPLQVRVADALDRQQVRAALRGCDSAVVAIAGDARTIVETVEPVYFAAADSGLRRLVHLSSASVHGQSPPAGTDELTPLSDRQPIEYNNAKVRAEQVLLRCRAQGATEVVLLRPGIVHGPRSQWIGALADDLLGGRAVLVEGGHGLCNSIYVDNLVHAVRCALTADHVDGQAFLIGDDEDVTWRDLYAPICTALGMDVDDLPQPGRETVDSPGAWARRRGEWSAIRRFLPAPVRAGLRAAVEAHRGAAVHVSAAPTPTLEQALLHTCGYRLPSSRARSILGYEPIVPFIEACRRSVEWLRFAGYPVVSPPET